MTHATAQTFSAPDPPDDADFRTGPIDAMLVDTEPGCSLRLNGTGDGFSVVIGIRLGSIDTCGLMQGTTDQVSHFWEDFAIAADDDVAQAFEETNPGAGLPMLWGIEDHIMPVVGRAFLEALARHPEVGIDATRMSPNFIAANPRSGGYSTPRSPQPRRAGMTTAEVDILTQMIADLRGRIDGITERVDYHLPALPRPRVNASLACWIAYAVSHGMDHAEAAAMTRAEIQACFEACLEA